MNRKTRIFIWSLIEISVGANLLLPLIEETKVIGFNNLLINEKFGFIVFCILIISGVVRAQKTL